MIGALLGRCHRQFVRALARGISCTTDFNIVSVTTLAPAYLTYTVLPQNLAAARFNFEALYRAATIQGWLDFEGSIYRDQHT